MFQGDEFQLILDVRALVFILMARETPVFADACCLALLILDLKIDTSTQAPSQRIKKNKQLFSLSAFLVFLFLITPAKVYRLCQLPQILKEGSCQVPLIYCWPLPLLCDPYPAYTQQSCRDLQFPLVQTWSRVWASWLSQEESNISAQA